MKYRVLGRTGIKVSEIGMGLEHLLDKDEQNVIDTIRTAIDGGVTYLDCHVGHDFQEDSVEYEGYKKLGKALDIPVVDIRSEFIGRKDLPELIGEDGMHLKQKGYELIVRTVCEQLIPV